MQRNLEKLANQIFDVLVIGGGIHGAVTAWDAVLRGLSVALIERADFGSGTSQNSLKIIHGGLRYLQDGNLSRIRTMVRERTAWMKIAPHLIHPLTCLMPTTHRLARSQFAMSIALQLNDLLSFDRNQLDDPEKELPGGMIVSQRELSRILPGYDLCTATGGAVWHDAQIYNSERLLLEFILSATNMGAEAANYVEAIGFLQQNDRIMGIQARDSRTGQIFDIRSRLVINCAGAWVDHVLETVHLHSEYALSIAMNVFVDQVWSGVAVGLQSQPGKEKRSQVLFIVPWRNKSMIGTCHIPGHGAPHVFRPNEETIQNFLDQINTVRLPCKLSLKDVHHVTWGFLPINKAGAHTEQIKLTRDGVVIDHQKTDRITGLISVLGVKYTTARAVAEQAVDLAVTKLGLKTPKCETQITPIHGGQIDDFKIFVKHARATKHRTVDEEIIDHLAYTYGSHYGDIVQSMKRQPDLVRRMDSQLPITAAEIVHSVQHEMALTLADVVERRTELGSTGMPCIETLQKCARLMATELEWSSEREQQEVKLVIQDYCFHRTETVTV
jgi:glycerol-3-phosphate dehydrogenase